MSESMVWKIQSTYRDIQPRWTGIKLSCCSIYTDRQQLQLAQYSVSHLALLPRSSPSHTDSDQWQNIVRLGLNAECSKTKGLTFASWTLRNLAPQSLALPQQASWKNPPYQVEAEPLKALNIHQLQSRETQVWFKRTKITLYLSFKLWMWRINRIETTGTFLLLAPAVLWWKVKGVSSPPEIRGPSRAWQAFRRTVGTLATTNKTYTPKPEQSGPFPWPQWGRIKFCTPHSKCQSLEFPVTMLVLVLAESFVCLCTI